MEEREPPPATQDIWGDDGMTIWDYIWGLTFVFGGGTILGLIFYWISGG